MGVHTTAPDTSAYEWYHLLILISCWPSKSPSQIGIPGEKKHSTLAYRNSDNLGRIAHYFTPIFIAGYILPWEKEA